jgi:Cu+-exporting ATPase
VPGGLETHAALREASGATAVFAAWGGDAKALLVFGDAVKPNAREAVARLRARGLDVWLLSGDSETTTAAVAGVLGIEAYRGGASPEEKVALLRDLQARGRRVGVVGDGVNDAAALAAAEVGIGVAAGAACVAWQAADVALLTGDPLKILRFQELAGLTVRLLRQNLFFAFLYNALAIPLAVSGALNPLVAAAAMMASSLTVVANTARLWRGAAAAEAASPPLRVLTRD